MRCEGLGLVQLPVWLPLAVRNVNATHITAATMLDDLGFIPSIVLLVTVVCIEAAKLLSVPE